MPFKSFIGGESTAILQAFNRSQAIISFKPDGTVNGGVKTGHGAEQKSATAAPA